MLIVPSIDVPTGLILPISNFSLMSDDLLWRILGR